jgi:hypothetical protein
MAAGGVVSCQTASGRAVAPSVAAQVGDGALYFVKCVDGKGRLLRETVMPTRAL